MTGTSPGTGLAIAGGDVTEIEDGGVTYSATSSSPREGGRPADPGERTASW